MNDFSGQSFGRYHLIEKLGEGGMATVYKAYDTHLECEVAVKVIRTDMLAPVVLGRALKRFEHEAKAVAKLNHPNIVRVSDYGEFEGVPYLVMPLMAGGTIKSYLKEHGRLPWKQAMNLVIPIAEALGYAHEHDVIHRDIKPSNILLTEKGQPMLTDFGVAKIVSDEATQDLTGTSATVGTPEYMAPEQITSKTVDGRADIYGLGVVLYEMITGRRPYEADTFYAVMLKQANDPLPDASKFVKDLPREVEYILFKALAKKPQDRYQNMGDFADEMAVLERKEIHSQTVHPNKAIFAQGKSNIFATSSILKKNVATEKASGESQPGYLGEETFVQDSTSSSSSLTTPSVKKVAESRDSNQPADLQRSTDSGKAILTVDKSRHPRKATNHYKTKLIIGLFVALLLLFVVGTLIKSDVIHIGKFSIGNSEATATFSATETSINQIQSTHTLTGSTPTIATATQEIITGTLNSNVNCRVGPDKRYPFKGTYEKGSTFTVIGESEDKNWYFVNVNGATCWFRTDLIQVDNKNVTLPLITSMPTPTYLITYKLTITISGKKPAGWSEPYIYDRGTYYTYTEAQNMAKQECDWWKKYWNNSCTSSITEVWQ